MLLLEIFLASVIVATCITSLITLILSIKFFKLAIEKRKEVHSDFDKLMVNFENQKKSVSEAIKNKDDLLNNYKTII